MKLADAKRHLKSYVKFGALDPVTLESAIEKIVASWSSRVKKPGGGRAKGHGYERTVAGYLRSIYPTAERGLQSRGGGEEVPDVNGTPLWVECKRHRKVPGALSLYYRAREEASDGRPAVLVLKEDGRPEVAVVSLDLLLGLLRYASVDPADPSMRRVCEVGERLMEGEK